MMNTENGHVVTKWMNYFKISHYVKLTGEVPTS